MFARLSKQCSLCRACMPKAPTVDQLSLFAQEAALSAGAKLMEYFGRISAADLIAKEETDFATRADQEADALIHAAIRRAYPAHAILSEELSPETIVDAAEYVWIVDPLDGTTAFKAEKEDFCVSMGLMHKGKIILGVIFAPKRNELYIARADQPSVRRVQSDTESVIQVDTQTKSLQRATVVFDMGKNARKVENLETSVKIYAALMHHANGVNYALSPASGAISGCDVARGRLQGLVLRNAKQWDVAALIVIAEKAGARVTDLHGQPIDLRQREIDILIAPTQLHDQFIAMFQERVFSK